MGFKEVGAITYPARVRESYAQDLLETLDSTRSGRAPSDRRRLRLLGRVVRAAARARPAWDRGGRRARVHHRPRRHRLRRARPIEQAKRLVAALNADLGVVFDRAAERLYLIDERAQEIPLDRALLLYLQLIGSNGRKGKLAFPVTVTNPRRGAARGKRARDRADACVARRADEGRPRAPTSSLPARSAAATCSRSSFRATTRSRASRNLLELLAPVERPLSELVAALPESPLVH